MSKSVKDFDSNINQCVLVGNGNGVDGPPLFNFADRDYPQACEVNLEGYFIAPLEHPAVCFNPSWRQICNLILVRLGFRSKTEMFKPVKTESQREK